MTWFDFLLWVPYTLYVAAYVPQIIKNYQEQSSEGLSSSMVLIRFSADLLYLLCAYLLAFPLAYKVMIPLCCLAMLKLIIQDYWYSDDEEEAKGILSVLAIIAATFFLLGVFGMVMPVIIGRLAAAGAILLYICAELPQLYANYEKKSLEGYSFSIPSLLAVGALFEIGLVWYLLLPRQALYAAMRILLFFSLYCAQYIKYHLIAEEA